MLGGDAFPSTESMRICPGPATLEDTPTFFARGFEISPDMKDFRLSLEERLKAGLAYGGMLLLFALLPLVLSGSKLLVYGIGIVILSSLTAAFALPYLDRGKRWMLKILLAVLGLGLIHAMVGYSFELPIYQSISLGLSACFAFGWIYLLLTRLAMFSDQRRRFRHNS
jgi:hypothetical protein